MCTGRECGPDALMAQRAPRPHHPGPAASDVRRTRASSAHDRRNSTALLRSRCVSPWMGDTDILVVPDALHISERAIARNYNHNGVTGL